MAFTPKYLQIFVYVFSVCVCGETAFTSETVELLFHRSPKDENNYFLAYRISKGNDSNTIIALGKEQDGKGGKCVNDSMLLDQCNTRYSLLYLNDTYLSFSISNLVLQDSGLYICQAFFLGTNHDPEYAEINLNVQERPSTRTTETATTTQTNETTAPKAKSGRSERPGTQTPETATTTQAHETTALKAKSGHSDIQFAVALSALIMFHALFQLFQ